MLHVDQLLQNRYRVIRILGQGGMGAVYQAHDLSLDVACVVKEMLPPEDPALVKNMAIQFQREGKILAGLRHLSLPRVTNYFTENDYYYLVMDLIAGRSLEKMIDTSGLPEAVVLKYGDQLLDVLEYIHGQGVLHRDIKPANIVIQPDDRAVLVDFGLVKVVSSGLQPTKTLISALSPQYAPPEQYTGNTDQRSDLYSLAATLYQSLAGHPPSSATDQMSGARLMPLRQLPHLQVPVSANTEYVLMKALSLDRNARYQDAATMRAELIKGSGKVYQAAALAVPVGMNAATQVWSPTMAIPGQDASGVPVPIPIGTSANARVKAAATERKPMGKTGIIGIGALGLVVVAAIAAIVVLAGKPPDVPAAPPATAIPATVQNNGALATTSPTVAQNTATFTPAPSATAEPSQTPTATDTPAPATQTATAAPSVTPLPNATVTQLPVVTIAPVATIGTSPLPPATTAPQALGMLFAAPVLLEPSSGFSFRFPSVPLLKWSPVANLGADDYYLLEITHQQGVDPTYTKDTATPPKNYIIDLPRDPYLWRVTVVRKTADGYTAVSPPSAQWEFRWTKPKPTATPKPKKP